MKSKFRDPVRFFSPSVLTPSGPALIKPDQPLISSFCSAAPGWVPGSVVAAARAAVVPSPRRSIPMPPVSGSLGAAGSGGIRTGMMINSKSLQTTQVDVVFFDANPTTSTCTDKTAFSLATADFDKVVGYLTVPGTAANGAGWVAGTVG